MISGCRILLLCKANIRNPLCDLIWLKKQYAGTNFRKKSIVLVPQLLSPYMNYKYKAMVTKFDAKGKLVGEIQIERSGNMDKPGVSYPAIVKTYVVVVRVPKAQEAMIDYYQIAFQD